MLLTVRNRIVEEIKAAMAAIVIEPGAGQPSIAIEMDLAVYQQAGRTDEWANQIKAALGEGRVTFELVFGPSEMVVPEGTQGSARENVDTFDMGVLVIAHLPDVLPKSDDGQPVTPERMGDLVATAVYQIAGTLGLVDGQTQCGRWLNVATRISGEPVGMALAQSTMVESYGGVGLTDLSTRAVQVMMVVRYRIQPGSPEVPR